MFIVQVHLGTSRQPPSIIGAESLLEIHCEPAHICQDGTVNIAIENGKNKSRPNVTAMNEATHASCKMTWGSFALLEHIVLNPIARADRVYRRC